MDPEPAALVDSLTDVYVRVMTGFRAGADPVAKWETEWTASRPVAADRRTLADWASSTSDPTDLALGYARRLASILLRRQTFGLPQGVLELLDFALARRAMTGGDRAVIQSLRVLAVTARPMTIEFHPNQIESIIAIGDRLSWATGRPQYLAGATDALQAIEDAGLLDDAREAGRPEQRRELSTSFGPVRSNAAEYLARTRSRSQVGPGRIRRGPSYYLFRLSRRLGNLPWISALTNDIDPYLADIRQDFYLDEERIDLDRADQHDDGAFLNIGFADGDDANRDRSTREFAPGDAAWLWVEVGPRTDDAIAGDVQQIIPAHLQPGHDLELVVFADEDLRVSPSAQLGWLRVVEHGPFPVTDRPKDAELPAVADDRLDHRLYARVTVPSVPGTWRLRVGIFLRGVLIHMEEVQIPVGIGAPARVRTRYRLTRDLSAMNAAQELIAPSLTIYANAGEQGTHDFCFYLPGGDQPALTSTFNLDSGDVITFTDTARRRLRWVSWGSEEERPEAPKFRRLQAGGPFGRADDVASALVQLAVAGRNLWSAFTRHVDSDPAFARRLRQVMGPTGSVQLAVKQDPDLVLPLQLLYDGKLDTSAPGYLHVCAATRTWLDDPRGDPPCLTAPCPDLADDHAVCVAGFWGIRHAVSIGPAFPRAGLDPVVHTSTRPPATLAHSTDPEIGSFWAAHAQRLDQLLTVSGNPAITSKSVFTSLADHRSVLLYFLAHVGYDNNVPRIIMDSTSAYGSLNYSTVENAELDLTDRRPLVFINACASAGITPARLLGLVDAFVAAGAGGAVGTEISVFVDFAAAFAEAMLAGFTAGQTLGESLRRARIELLRQLNPLGFVYVGFGLHDLRLVLDALVPVVA